MIQSPWQQEQTQIEDGNVGEITEMTMKMRNIVVVFERPLLSL